MSANSIYTDLRKAGMTHAGACAMLGNMEAESSLIANIAQRGMTSLSDADYTAKFDSDPDGCIKDACGYGLCQWTFWSRKSNLWQFAQNWGVSVGAEDMQTAFCIHELKEEYSSLWKFLCSTDDTYEATRRICVEFERPAVNNVATRYAFAEKHYETLVKITSPAPQPSLSDVIAELESIIAKLKKIGGKL